MSLFARAGVLVLTAFMDDSADGFTEQDEPVFVLGGCIAFADEWDRFTAEWQERLPLVRPSTAFKMREVASRWGEDDERIMFFYRVIEAHVLSTFSCVIPVADFERAFARFPEKFRDQFTIYNFAFHELLKRICASFTEMGYLGKIKFVFDEHMNEDEKVLRSWNTVFFDVSRQCQGEDRPHSSLWK